MDPEWKVNELHRNKSFITARYSNMRRTTAGNYRYTLVQFPY